MKVDHLSILVKNLETGVDRFSALFGNVYKIEDIPTHQVRVAIFNLSNIKIELVQPYPENTKLLKRLEEKGEGLHHLALDLENTNTEKKLNLQSLKFVDAKSKGALDRDVQFLHPREYCGTLVEILS